MIHHVADRKAILASVAGTVAWEIVARPLIFIGMPFFSIVDTLGAVALPNASTWASWSVGMLLHLIVGAIWAVFYAYFFWSVLPLRPALQVWCSRSCQCPWRSASCARKLQLMRLKQAGDLPDMGLFGLSGGLYVGYAAERQRSLRAIAALGRTASSAGSPKRARR